MSYRDDLHNEMNPDMRSFGSKGTSSINPHDEADKEEAEEKAEADENADEPEMEDIEETEAGAHGYDREVEFDCDETEDEEDDDSSGDETEHYKGY